MTGLGYAFKGYNKETMAKAIGRSLPISTRQSVEICNYLRNRPLTRVKTILENVMKLKQAIPYKRYNDNIGHKPGMAAGRYPQKACTHILQIVKSAEANAQLKGLSSGSLYVVHICAQKAPTQWHYGRHFGRKMKRTHIEVVLQEKAAKEATKEKKSKPSEKKGKGAKQ